MRNPLKYLPLAIPLLGIALTAIASSPKGQDWDKEANVRKAEYMFLEAQSAYSDRDYDKYVALLERAYALDSTDIDIAGEWAMLAYMDDNTDSAKLEKAYRLIKRRFYANPSNFTSGEVLAKVANDAMKYDDAVRVWEILDSIYPTRPEISEELARSYLRSSLMGDSTAYDKAMAIYDRLQAGSGRSIDLTSQRVTAYFVKSDTLAIINELDSLYAHAPNDSYTALYVGANFDHLDMPDEAIKYYNRACELDSTNGSAYLQRARFYNQQGDSAAFDREVFLALKSHSLEVDSKVEILKSYVSELFNDTLQEPRIRQLFNDLQLMHPGESEIHELYGSYLFVVDDYAGAAEQFSYVTALDPSDEAGWQTYVQMSAMAEDTTGMVNAASEAMKRFPENFYFPIVISTTYSARGEYGKAVEVLESVDIGEVHNAKAVSNFLATKGDVYSMYGDTIKALQLYDEAIEINPENSMAMNNAAYFMALTGGDLDKAEKYSARSLAGDELNPTYLDTYAWVLFKKKDYAMAKHYIDIALNAYTQPQDNEGAGTDDPVTAEEEAEEAIEAIVEPSADIYDHAGDIYFMNGETEQALEFWRKAHELDPTDPIIEKKVVNKTIFMR